LLPTVPPPQPKHTLRRSSSAPFWSGVVDNHTSNFEEVFVAQFR
jgi:hypothetical protein